MRRVRDRRPSARKVPSPMPHVARRAMLATFLAALVLPGTAAAAIDVSRAGGTLTVTGSTSGDSMVTVASDADGIYVAGSEIAVQTTDKADCQQDEDFVSCGDGELTVLNFSLTGPGSDEVEINGDTFSENAAMKISLGDGDDVLTFSGQQGVIADLGPGNDDAFTDAGRDVVHGGDGNDTFRLEAGDDEAYGDGGNDTFRASTGPDGADMFDGGADSPTFLRPYDADTVSYAARTSSAKVQLPPVGATAFSFGNGLAAEGDGLRKVENAIGSTPALGDSASATSKLYGNDGPNLLLSGAGADVLVGAGGNDLLHAGLGWDELQGNDGDDILDARSDYWYAEPSGQTAYVPDLDVSLDCGSSTNDGVRRDEYDPDAANCEHQAPFMTEPPQLAGAAAVGGKLNIVRPKSFGEANQPRITWYGCAGAVPAQTRLDDPEFDVPGCAALSQADTYAPTPADVGRRIVARIELLWPRGDGDSLWTASSGPVGPGGPPLPGGTLPPGGGGGSKVSGPFAQASAQLAQRQLGMGAFASNITLGAGTVVYEAPIAKGGRVTLRGSTLAAIAGVACEQACTVTAGGSIVLVPKAKKKGRKGKRSALLAAAAGAAKTKKSKYRTLKLRPQVIKVAASSIGVVKVNATSAHRKLIKKAKKAKLTFAYSLKYADGTTRTAKKSYLIKVG